MHFHRDHPPPAYGFGYPPYECPPYTYPHVAATAGFGESTYVSMQHCYRRANEHLTRALEIDESGREDISSAIDLYSKAVVELENGISYSGNNIMTGEEAVSVEKLRKKMMTNLDNARDRVNFLSRDKEMRKQSGPTHQLHPPSQTEPLQSGKTSRDKFQKPPPKWKGKRKVDSKQQGTTTEPTISESLQLLSSGSQSEKFQKSSPEYYDSKKTPVDNKKADSKHQGSDSLQQLSSAGQSKKDNSPPQSPKHKQSLPSRKPVGEDIKRMETNQKAKTSTLQSKKVTVDCTKSEGKREETPPTQNLREFLQVPSVIQNSSAPQSPKSRHASPSRKPPGIDSKKNSTQKGVDKKNTGSRIDKTYNRRATTESTRGSNRQSSFKKGGVDKKSATSTGKKPPASAKEDNKSIVADLKGVDKTLAETILEEVVDSDSSVTTWDDIVGLELPKQTLKEIVILPALRPELFTGLRSPCRGLLLFGPPGNGKTMLAKAVAHESQAKFFNISASSLTSKWLGDGERLVRALFALARKLQPSVIFLDEVDALLSRRGDSEHDSMRRLKNEFLQSFDGMHTTEGERILVMAATNRPQELDDAALRRFGKRIYIPLPGLEARRAVLENLISRHHHCITDGQMEKLAEITEGYSGSDLKTLASDASLGPLRELDLETLKSVPADKVRPINIHDFEQSLLQSRSSVSHDLIKALEKWNINFGVSA